MKRENNQEFIKPSRAGGRKRDRQSRGGDQAERSSGQPEEVSSNLNSKLLRQTTRSIKAFEKVVRSGDKDQIGTARKTLFDVLRENAPKTTPDVELNQTIDTIEADALSEAAASTGEDRESGDTNETVDRSGTGAAPAGAVGSETGRKPEVPKREQKMPVFVERFKKENSDLWNQLLANYKKRFELFEPAKEPDPIRRGHFRAKTGFAIDPVIATEAQELEKKIYDHFIDLGQPKDEKEAKTKRVASAQTSTRLVVGRIKTEAGLGLPEELAVAQIGRKEKESAALVRADELVALLKKDEPDIYAELILSYKKREDEQRKSALLISQAKIREAYEADRELQTKIKDLEGKIYDYFVRKKKQTEDTAKRSTFRVIMRIQENYLRGGPFVVNQAAEKIRKIEREVGLAAKEGSMRMFPDEGEGRKISADSGEAPVTGKDEEYAPKKREPEPSIIENIEAPEDQFRLAVARHEEARIRGADKEELDGLSKMVVGFGKMLQDFLRDYFRNQTEEEARKSIRAIVSQLRQEGVDEARRKRAVAEAIAPKVRAEIEGAAPAAPTAETPITVEELPEEGKKMMQNWIADQKAFVQFTEERKDKRLARKELDEQSTLRIRALNKSGSFTEALVEYLRQTRSISKDAAGSLAVHFLNGIENEIVREVREVIAKKTEEQPIVEVRAPALGAEDAAPEELLNLTIESLPDDMKKLLIDYETAQRDATKYILTHRPKPGGAWEAAKEFERDRLNQQSHDRQNSLYEGLKDHFLSLGKNEDTALDWANRIMTDSMLLAQGEARREVVSSAGTEAPVAAPTAGEKLSPEEIFEKELAAAKLKYTEIMAQKYREEDSTLSEDDIKTLTAADVIAERKNIEALVRRKLDKK